MRIEELDKNFSVKNIDERPDTEWYDSCSEPFEIFGLMKPSGNEGFRRMPIETARSVSDGVMNLSRNTAGGRVRFATDSPYIAICVLLDEVCRLPHMAATGVRGFDLYVNYYGRDVFVASFQPDINITDGYSAYIDVSSELGNGLREYTINFPLYNGVKNLAIGVKRGSRVTYGKKYETLEPIVYYGSSITQGACATRPGLCYESIISRRFEVDYINLGFSGNAKGEPQMAEYIAGLPMSLFVCDYDYNAETKADLEKTHYNFYEIFRKTKPKTPYVMISRPNIFGLWSDCNERKSIIKKSYDKAKERGDKNVYFIDGAELFAGVNSDDCTVDGCHPNDMGFYRMARVIGNRLEKIISEERNHK